MLEMFFIFYLLGRYSTNPIFGLNLNEFVRRFDAATTNGQGKHSLSSWQMASTIH